MSRFRRRGLKSYAIGKGAFRRRKDLGRRIAGKIRSHFLRTSRKGFSRTSGYYGRFAGTGAELKFHDLDIDDASVAQNGTIIQSSCCLIAQGVTESTRVGRRATIRSINWRFSFTLTSTTDLTACQDVVRLILYVDKQCNGATAAITDILESDNYQSFNNLANKSRFRTLMDRTYDLSPTAAGGDGTSNDTAEVTIHDSYYKTCALPIEWDSTTGAITEIRSNNIGVLIVSKEGGVVSMDSKMRLRFSDTG